MKINAKNTLAVLGILATFTACTNNKVTEINKERLTTIENYLHDEYSKKEGTVKEFKSLEVEAEEWQNGTKIKTSQEVQ